MTRKFWSPSSIQISGSQPDDKEVLVAVLNTNFWLATHVLVITAGYGASIFAGVLGHLYLVSKLLKPEASDRIFQKMHFTALIALLLTATGTILGGIWADQSWGRFWGWDPKENGALLIVLWLVWAIHGRISGHIKKPDYAALTGLLNIIVALEGLGVNVLNVGLHSYGFISGIAFGLISFCLAELIIIGTLYTLARRKKDHHAA